MGSVEKKSGNGRIQNVLVLGGGSAGFLAAITLKIKLPHLDVTVLRSKELGIIGVGEGTTNTVPHHLFGFLKVAPKRFYEIARPMWKLGIRFEWGTRPYFNYTFALELDTRYTGLNKGTGHYCQDTSFDCLGSLSALMTENRAFYRSEQGGIRLNRRRDRPAHRERGLCCLARGAGDRERREDHRRYGHRGAPG
jgi:tryptophan halogenase